MNDRSTPPTDPTLLLELSGLIDGEDLDPGRRITAAWAQDAGLRECWHTWHLVGEVLRSEDAPTDPAGDAAFLTRLRHRLAEEPTPASVTTVLPTAGASGAVPLRQMFIRRLARFAVGAAAPMAAAAALVMWLGPVGRTTSPDRGAMPVATRADVDRQAIGPVAVAVPSGPQGAMTSRVALRDSGLDPYLSAHRLGALGSPTWPATSVAHPVDVVVEFK
jgi:sigma-E factor negative regulatory protein RseA